MTIETLRPDETVLAGWSLVGAATAHGATSDDSDGTYLSGSGGAQLVLGLTSVTLPAGAVTRSVTPRWRARAGVTGSSVLLVVTQPAAAEQTAGVTSFGAESEVARSAAVLSTTMAANSGAPSPWLGDQNALNALRLTVTAPSGDFAHVAELYVDVDVVPAPTTSVLAPTGTVTTTTSVLLEWLHNPSAGGGPQAFVHARVFSAAQRAVAGFNPETSAATYDSGVVVGSGRSMRTPPLPNDTAYRAYVRTAQSVNGRPHWAAWDTAFTDFVLDAAAPVVASVFAAGNDDQWWVRLTVSLDAAGESWDFLEVQRTDDNGVSWEAVRGATFVDPPGSVWIGYDVGAPNGATVRYRARGIRVVNGSQIAGDWELSNSTSWSSPDPILKDLQYPANSRKVKIRNPGDPTLPVVQGAFNVLGANRKTVISDVATGEEGELMFRTSTFEEAADMAALLQLPVLLLQLPPGWDVRQNLYFARGAVQRVHVSQKIEGRAAQMRFWRVPYIEVDPPLDVGVEVLATTWEDLDDQGLTWAGMLAAGTTWGDLL